MTDPSPPRKRALPAKLAEALIKLRVASKKFQLARRVYEAAPLSVPNFFACRHRATCLLERIRRFSALANEWLEHERFHLVTVTDIGAYSSRQMADEDCRGNRVWQQLIILHAQIERKVHDLEAVNLEP